MSKGTRSSRPGRTVLGVMAALALAGLLVVGTSCESLTSTSPAVSAGVETSPSSTTAQSAADSAPQPTPTVAETVAAPGPPDVLLDESDFGKQVRLHVGDRVRVDLPAHPTAEKGEVTSVEWRYSTGGIVQQIDAGTNTTDGFVTECWLELEAIAPGDVTIRTIYLHEDTTTRAKWVIYLTVTE